MARTLERLKEQYHSEQKGPRRMMGPGPRGGGGGRGMAKGKPKNAKATIAR